MSEEVQELLKAEAEFRQALPHLEPEALLKGYQEVINLAARSELRDRLIGAKDAPSVNQQHRLTIYAIGQEILRRMAK